MNGAEAIIRTLIDAGVGTVFGYPGGAVIPLYHELYKYQDQIHHVRLTHEQHVVHAADGYARATGNVGVCFVTSGPGATNTITGIATAFLDSIPLVVIAGQVPSGLLAVLVGLILMTIYTGAELVDVFKASRETIRSNNSMAVREEVK